MQKQQLYIISSMQTVTLFATAIITTITTL